MKIKLLTLSVLLSISTLAFATDDLLDRRELPLKSERFGDVIALTAQNLKDVLDGYQIALGPGFSIVKPLVVSGTQAAPNIQATVRKCFAFVCRNVEVDADLTITKVDGECDENYYLKADLHKSGELLTDVYDHFYTQICARRSSEGATISLTSYASRADTYNGGLIASTIQEFLELQITPIMESLQTELNKNIRIVEGH